MITFLSLLALLCVAFLVVAWSLAAFSKLAGGMPQWLVPLREGIGEVALWMAFAVAAVTTFGSLWLSEAEKLPPCVLCWYQRICMYPQAVILFVAAVRRDVAVRWYALPLVGIGMAVSTWHYLLERFPGSVPKVCDTEVPCDTVWIWKYHFLSIPGMAWVAFATIATLLVLARPAVAGRGDVGTVDPEPELEAAR